jgi:hypothetical protein
MSSLLAAGLVMEGVRLSREGGDEGNPVALTDSTTAKTFADLAGKVKELTAAG